MSDYHAQSLDNVIDDGARCSDATFMIRRCAACDKFFTPMTAACFSCASRELEWVASSGIGSVVSWQVVDCGPGGADGEPAPLTIAIVELDEGPWVYTSIEGQIRLPASCPVRVHFEPRPPHDGFPVFAVDADPRITNHRRTSLPIPRVTGRTNDRLSRYEAEEPA